MIQRYFAIEFLWIARSQQLKTLEVRAPRLIVLVGAPKERTHDAKQLVLQTDPDVGEKKDPQEPGVWLYLSPWMMVSYSSVKWGGYWAIRALQTSCWID
jgi:hypothetical protein